VQPSFRYPLRYVDCKQGVDRDTGHDHGIGVGSHSWWDGTNCDDRPVTT
jgi:hypothetical protein